jgi:hydroxymethylbilane synthase
VEASQIEGLIRIGSRPSELALRRARVVESLLEAAGASCEIVSIKTAGDKKRKNLAAPLGEAGLFTRALETALAKGKVDCCVHSLRDLPVEMLEGLEIVAQLERDDPRDVLVVNPVTQADSLESIPAGSRVGTSSPTRRAQLLARRPDLEVVDLRGDVPTRLRKVESGQVHATIFAASDLIRLNATQRITAWFEPPGWLPVAGQGVTAVQIRSDDGDTRALLAPHDHTPTSVATRAERAFLASLDSGGHAPIGALVLSNMILHGFVSDPNGRTIVRGSRRVDPSAPEESGETLAAELRERGAGSLLAEMRSAERAKRIGT